MARINALTEQWHGCYRELGALAEADGAGRSWDEVSAPVTEKLRSIEGRLAQAWEVRRWQRRSPNIEHSRPRKDTKLARR